MRRDWSAARAKCEREGRCRLCRRPGAVEAAHTIGRKNDDKSGVVRPVDIIPLCRSCHQGFDARKLSVLAVMDYEEQAAAVGHVGILRALRRLDPVSGE